MAEIPRVVSAGIRRFDAGTGRADVKGVSPKPLVDRTFWFFAIAFIFILFANRAGLAPGAGSIGWGRPGDHGVHVEQPLLRGANADVNLTLAMALVLFAAWIV